MQLTDVQKETVRKWVAEGASHSEVQKKLSSEMGISMIFMDVRLLMLELGVSVKDKAEPKVQKKVEPQDLDDAGDADLAGADDLGGGGVSVQVDRILKPGTVVSGTVTFSDGVSATWGLDATGRLMLGGAKPGYQPNEQDLRQFQLELKKILSQKGF